jgi:hypothetical protein
MSNFLIVTPLHATGNKFIEDAYASLCIQTRKDWLWSIVENNGGKASEKIAADPRVRITQSTSSAIGALKLQASLVDDSTPWIVELDCDDELRFDALELIAKVFESGADFVYSDFADWLDNRIGIIAEHPGYPYNPQCGWGTYKTPYKGTELLAMRAPPATAQNIRLVDWAPNHVRVDLVGAFRASRKS